MRYLIIGSLILLALFVGVGYMLKDSYEYCTEYKIVQSFDFSQRAYRSTDYSDFYVTFTDGTATKFMSREGNTPIVGQPLCLNYHRVYKNQSSNQK